METRVLCGNKLGEVTHAGGEERGMYAHCLNLNKGTWWLDKFLPDIKKKDSI